MEPSTPLGSISTEQGISEEAQLRACPDSPKSRKQCKFCSKQFLSETAFSWHIEICKSTKSTRPKSLHDETTGMLNKIDRHCQRVQDDVVAVDPVQFYRCFASCSRCEKHRSNSKLPTKDEMHRTIRFATGLSVDDALLHRITGVRLAEKGEKGSGPSKDIYSTGKDLLRRLNGLLTLTSEKSTPGTGNRHNIGECVEFRLPDSEEWQEGRVTSFDSLAKTYDIEDRLLALHRGLSSDSVRWATREWTHFPLDARDYADTPVDAPEYTHSPVDAQDFLPREDFDSEVETESEDDGTYHHAQQPGEDFDSEFESESEEEG